MATESLEQRVAALERQVGELKEALGKGSGKKDWRRTAGVFAGDEVMKEVFAEALKYREQDRKRTRPRHTKKKRVRS